MLMIGLDIGGTKIEAQLALIESTSGNQSIPIATTQQKLYLTVLAKMRRPTQRQQGYSAVMANISLLIKDLLEQQQLQLQELAGIGVGLPGTIDPASSTMLNGNSQIFIHQPFARDLQQHLGTDLPVHCTNDANLFTLAEVYGGVGPKYAQQFNRPISCHTAVGLILGTGVGGGVILSGEVLLGRFGGGAEVGHTTLVNNGEPCYCGRQGCAECYLSGTGLERNYQNITGQSLKGAEIFQQADSKVKAAVDTVTTYRQHLQQFLLNLTNTFDPDYFVLGGGISLQPAIYQGVEAFLKEQSFVPNSAPKVYQHQLGDSAGGSGAVIFCAEKECLT